MGKGYQRGRDQFSFVIFIFIRVDGVGDHSHNILFMEKKKSRKLHPKKWVQIRHLSVIYEDYGR